MSQSWQPGWYSDPAGDTSKVRWWDGARWTDSYADAQHHPDEPCAPNDGEARERAERERERERAEAAELEREAREKEVREQAEREREREARERAEQERREREAREYEERVRQAYQQGYAAGANASVQVAYAPKMQTMSDTDHTLRLIALVLDLVVLAANLLIALNILILFIVPVAWMLPMAMITWGVYRGSSHNSTALGVCTLLFFNIVSGILLLCSRKGV